MAGWWSLVPPLVAIGLALLTREVFLSLLAGILVGSILLHRGHLWAGLRELFDQLVAVFADAGNTRILFFCLLVGGLMTLLQASGGVEGFIARASRWRWARSRIGAQWLVYGLGLLIFVESSITCLITGAVGRPLFDRLRISREKLAYFCDATSAPVCMQIPLNGWGAYVLGLLMAQGLSEAMAVQTLAQSLLYNFYSLLILFSLPAIIYGLDFGPMRAAELRAQHTGKVLRDGAQPLVSEELVFAEPPADRPRRALNMLLPLAVMIGMIPLGLWITGAGNLMQGSGSTAVLWAVSAAIVVALGLGLLQGLFSLSQGVQLVLRGSSGLLAVTILLVFAFALSHICRELGLGPYVAGLISPEWPVFWIPALVFLVGCFVSFTLGSSWGAFAILMPVAVPLAQATGLPLPLVVAAVLSGGVFGDHTSPLSDTTIISSMASVCDHMDHVRTQLPYGLLAAALAAVAFGTAGWLFSR
ncbi:MAG: sodium:proton antiporter [Bacteroidetes bacterium]|nr:sodium:proton antiporter [Rhodothermia bacterium]MCS7154655.1 sodium:proton antiporter [Bacteroidota bacterium]MCX7906372.1 sodium:proton antiporter [Bacteroidota bacterium]MDW8137448.1 Na+/H+ antiporter NhaC family protein [Bacteroidota bacterium]MDW8285598.1 Na+/H+ antiporter NhaC family protein [Bacteroidota bacterium]